MMHEDIDTHSLSTLGVLMYLFKNHMKSNCSLLQPEETLATELGELGFNDASIHQAFVWLTDLSSFQKSNSKSPLIAHQGLRVYSDDERDHFHLDALNFLTRLSHLNVITPYERETIINQALALDVDRVSLGILKWVTLMVLFNEPGRDAALAQLEAFDQEETQ